jgi:hypothetical protein
VLEIRLGAVVFEMNLAHGWNLVSLPIDPLDPSPSQLGEHIFGWADGLHTQVDALIAGRGYFVMNPGPAKTISIIGNVTTGPPVLTPGWNIVGLIAAPPYTPQPWQQALGQTDRIGHPIWTLAGETYSAAVVFSAGAGYWVYSD